LAEPRAPYAEEGLALLDVLAVQQLGTDRFVSCVTYDNGWRLYGGQACAQGLLSAGRTVEATRRPHSLHVYFLRMGTPALPVEYVVECDRDGRSFSSRTVTARQQGEVLLRMMVSFTSPDLRSTEDEQLLVAPAVEPPGDPGRPLVLLDFEQSVPSQTHPLYSYPTRHWLRCTAALPDDRLLDTAVVTYLSDLCSGHDRLPTSPDRAQATLDHALWFHRDARPTDWLLVDLASRGVRQGRGLYTGDVWTQDGRLVATLTQETLYRERRT
jgi:acyl-CoA thioesterase-2